MRAKRTPRHRPAWHRGRMRRLRSAVLALTVALTVTGVVLPAASEGAAKLCAVPAPIRERKAPQAVVVTMTGARTGTHATLVACTRRSNGTYVRSLGPYAARVGYNGMATGGTKREGDGRTPAGNFPLRQAFGTTADPGVEITWKRVGAKDVWVDDPASKLYNRAAKLPARGRWKSAEKLAQKAYRHAQVIGYNDGKPVPGRGSAIFLHESTGGATAGCVSISAANLLTLLRWERPGAWIGLRAS